MMCFQDSAGLMGSWGYAIISTSGDERRRSNITDESACNDSTTCYRIGMDAMRGLGVFSRSFYRASFICLLESSQLRGFGRE